MKTTLLLPNGFKKIGWAIFVPAFLLGCSICFFGENFDRWLFRETVMNNIAIIGTVVGALFIGFSREKIEDEMIQHIRLNALMAAMWINPTQSTIFTRSEVLQASSKEISTASSGMNFGSVVMTVFPCALCGISSLARSFSFSSMMLGITSVSMHLLINVDFPVRTGPTMPR